MNQCMMKTYNNTYLVQPAKIQISLHIHAVWSESSFVTCAFYSLKVIQRVLRYWVDLKADLSLCWSHRPYSRFCRILAYFLCFSKNKYCIYPEYIWTHSNFIIKKN